MKQSLTLGQKLVLYMAGATGVALVGLSAGMFLFYWIEFEFIADAAKEAPWPEASEWVVMFALWLLGLLGSALTAIRFGRKLILPLNSVASAARLIATGDLSARASSHPESATFKETQHLIADFNTMAHQLELGRSNMRTWHMVISHELRTPLTVLRGRLQGLAEGVFSPDPALFSTLIDQVESLTRIVDDLSTVARTDYGHLELLREFIDISKEVQSVVSVASPVCAEAGLKIEAELAPVMVFADGARIRQILLALLDNTRRYASPGRVWVETFSRRHYAILRVTDEGPGLPDEAGSSLFDPFWRGQNSGTTVGASSGIGLGLSIVQAIARGHGGEAFARNAHGGGAVFEVHFPRYTKE
jgi:two-component system sensor histidine kinase AdeS